MKPDWQPVATALVGSWPSQVASWGRDALAAYLAELEAREVTPEQALIAIRSCPGEQKFPPSAPELAALARQDPSLPTFTEALILVRQALKAWNRPLLGDYANEADMLKARDRNVELVAGSVHPRVASFIGSFRLSELQRIVMDLSDDRFGMARRRDLERAWTAHCAAHDGREVAAIASGRRGELAAFDPLRTFVGPPRQIGAGGGA
jgi:hypothetical protein